MKQVININFHGRVVPIEVSAFDILKQYTESLLRHFANEEGKEEIINDIESRIGELFQQRLQSSAACITDDDVNAIIKSMGRPEEFDNEEEPAATSQSNQNKTTQSTASIPKRLYRNENDKYLGGVCSGLANYFGIDPVIVRIVFVLITLAFGTGLLAYIILWVVVPSTSSIEIGGTSKKLFRNPDDKIIAGVCSGISQYFGISTWIPRLLFLLPLLSIIFHSNNFSFLGLHDFFQISFSPSSIIIYIILWLVLPEAGTTAEKLQMKGEKVDMNSIKNSITEEIKGVQIKASKLGNEAKLFATEKGKSMASDINTATQKHGKSLGDVIVLLVKIFLYFVLGCIAFALVVVLFALALASIHVFPLKDFITKDSWQNTFAYGTLIFFIAIPIIGIITFIIRRIAKVRSSGNAMGFTFAGLWIIGWACLILFISFIAQDFRIKNNIILKDVSISNPRVNKLEITGPDDILSTDYKYNISHFSPFSNLDAEDTFYLNNVHFRITKSKNDSFQVSMIKFANGKNRKDAENNAAQIKYEIIQEDTLLRMPVGIPIDKINKFRNQHVIITIAVPVGKKIQIDQVIWDGPTHKINAGWEYDNMDDYWGDEEHGWTTNTEYIQKEDGLYNQNGEAIDGSKIIKQKKREQSEQPEKPEKPEKPEQPEKPAPPVPPVPPAHT